MFSILEAAIVLLVIGVFSVIALKKKSLDKDGAFIAGVFGLVIYAIGGLSAFAALLVFFVAADFATRYSRTKKSAVPEKRTTGNILGNGGAALIALFLGSWIGFFCALSGALADTLSSEIGILSKSKPVLITNPAKSVPPGTEGGVTPLGFTATLLGAVLMAICYYIISHSAIGSIIVIASGFFGSVSDSFFGAVFERRKMLNNAEVNLFGSGSAALLGHLLFGLIK